MNRFFEEASGSAVQGVHPTAVIRGELVLGEGSMIGPFCVLDGSIKIGAGTRILANTVMEGNVLIGSRCTIGPHSVIGAAPQHRGYAGQASYLVIEDDVVIREFATAHRSMSAGLEKATRIGRGSTLMVGSHVAHDCRVGEYVTLANAVQLAGHVTVGDRAFVGGGAVIHQHVRIGRLAIIAGGEALAKDVMPYGAIFHDRHKGYNAVGCRRAGLDNATLRELRRAFLQIHASPSAVHAARRMRAEGLSNASAPVKELVEFIETSRRGIQRSAKADSERDAARSNMRA